MCLQPRRYLSVSVQLFYPFMQIPLHPADFRGDKIVAFDFSDACLFGQPVYNYFDYQDFFKLCFRLSF